MRNEYADQQRAQDREQCRRQCNGQATEVGFQLGQNTVGIDATGLPRGGREVRQRYAESMGQEVQDGQTGKHLASRDQLEAFGRIAFAGRLLQTNRGCRMLGVFVVFGHRQ